MFLQFEKTEKKTKILYYKHMNSRKRSSCKGDGPELLQMFTRVRSLCSLICLHLFRLSAKDRLLSPTRLQRLTNPKKSYHLNLPYMVSLVLGHFMMEEGSVCGLHRDPHIWGVFDFVLSAA